MGKNKFKFELPSTMIRLYMGAFDYEMYMSTKDEFKAEQARNEIITTNSEIQ